MLVYSIDGETYKHMTSDDALEELFDTLDISDFNDEDFCQSIWQGTKVEPKASEFVPAVVEGLSERAYDDCGEPAEDWPASNQAQDNELRELVQWVVDAWADDHKLQPNFYTVEDTEEIPVRLTQPAGPGTYGLEVDE